MASPILQLDIVIVGAGLSGIAASIECAKSGHNVTVLESTKELTEVGAGLQVTPNATRLLQSWGVYDRLKSAAVEPKSLTVHRYTGSVLSHEVDYDVQMRKKYGAPFADIHRGDLQLALVSRARQLGVVFKLNQKVVKIDFKTPRPTITAEIGSSGRSANYSPDLIVAADGLWSKCRECFLGQRDRPLPTGDLAYRVVLTLDQIEDQKLRDLVENPSVHFWIGPNAHAVGYSMRGGNMYNIVLLVPDDLPESVSKQAGSVEEIRKLFQGWDPILTQFLDYVSNVDKWKLMHRAPLDSWISERADFVMIGDSCHPMLPYLAQGANSSIEDGAVLGKLLANLTSRSQVPAALQMFEKLRKTRGEAIVRETFKQRQDFHMVDGPEQEHRDEVFLSKLGKEIDCAFPSRWQCPVVQPWLYGYDAEKEVAEALAKAKLDHSNQSGL
ncbi:FAD/NAD(P)-binding domain-containing protein [Aulographum hederae CBS 113979]|uniref:FAD/NAD(P)-binding domain-containing protein n=1 Tax=Aulographum hederae CBS 113979 TaxID=1176131 RepID=A0A6G1GPK1_9PEZI|nr:FAD/NAD(P)-binding domain-containing protein [Aulographum hederae CBS 113979]